MSGISAGDPWKISAAERAKHDSQFFQLKPVAGYITGDQARNFFLQSGLQMAVLGQIWSLADINADGKMDQKEFSIAMHLIQKKLHGYDLPRALPPSMKQDTGMGGMGSFGSVGMAPMAGAPVPSGMGTMGSGMVPMQQQPMTMGNMTPVRPGLVHSPYGIPISNGMPMMGGFPNTGLGGFPQPNSPLKQNIGQQYGSPVKMPASNSMSLTADWAVPQSSKLKYTQMFNMHDHMKRGHLTGLEARAILTRSGLVHSILAQVWGLSDIDNDGKLTCDEFILAMHLVDQAKSGQALPAKLTPDLIPPSYRKNKPGHAIGVPPGGLSGGIATLPAAPVLASQPIYNTGMQPPPPQADKFGDLLGGFNMNSTSSTTASPMQPNGTTASALDPDILLQATFEDRRKENFDKGQAELDRRRQLLADQQQKEKQARLAKEREDFEKREQKRLQQEQKKQQELGRQLEKQRQIEQQRDEERRKALEQREAARRELEHQRQLDWERQRRDQLMAEKQRMRTQVDEFHGIYSKYKVELEALDNKKTDLGTQIEEAKGNVNNVTSQIDRMRQSRDMKMHDIDKSQQECQTWRNKLLLVQQERQQMDIKAQAVGGNVDDTYTTVMHSYNSKKTNIEKLKTRLAEIEKETAKQLESNDSQNSEFNDMQKKLNGLQADNDLLKSNMYDKKSLWENRNTEKNKSNDAFSAFGSTDFTSSEISTTLKTNMNEVAKNKDVWESAFTSTSSDLTNVSASAFDNVSSTTTTTAGKDNQQAEEKSKDTWSKDLFSADLFANGTSSVSWGSSATPTTNSTTSEWNAFSPPVEIPAAGPPKPGYRKFVGVYQFEARNPDETSFSPGDIIWVKPDQSDAEEGWMGGEVNGKEGWFPQAYAEEVAMETIPQTHTAVTAAANNNTTPSDSMFTQEDNKSSSTTPIIPSTVTTGPPQEESGFDNDFAPISSSDTQNPNSLTASIDSSFTAVEPVAPSPTPGLGQTAPDGLQAQAVYTWRAKKDNHLTFEKGNIILVKEQQDMWWSGELNGKTGWFPKSYVKVIGGQGISAPQSTIAAVEPPSEPFPDMSTELYQNTDFTSSNSEQQHVTGENGLEQSVAIYTYSSNEPGDLVFNQGDIIIVTKKEADWWHGTIDNRTGMFPASYVKPMSEMQHVDTTASAPTLQSQEPDSYSSTAATSIPQATVTEASPSEDMPALGDSAILQTASEPDTGHLQTNDQKTSQKGAKKGEIAQVIAPYQATGNEQLALQPGQLIQVRKKSPSGWWEGELQARGQKRKIGWFPANYVKLLGGSGSARSTPADRSSLSTSPQPNESSRSATPVSLPAPTAAPSLEQVISLYNYAGQHEDELSFAKGSVINVLSKDDPDWWKGELNGSEGMFPSNYVSSLSEAITDDSKVQNAS